MKDSFKDRVAKLLLDPLRAYDFALSGGYALSELALTYRPTRDLDLFTSTYDVEAFETALEEATTALEFPFCVKEDIGARLQRFFGVWNYTK